MNHRDHVNLLKKGVPGKGGMWADLGSGTGAFTLALRECIGREGSIYSIDKDSYNLQRQKDAFAEMFPDSKIHYHVTDFTRPLDIPRLDGIVMANSLHFIQNKTPLLQTLRTYLKPNGRFLLVEYNVDRGNVYVPYPLSFSTWKQTAEAAGFRNVTFLSSVPSQFLNEIYSSQAKTG